eukprot:m.152073 g.152073  ORF g.152073 m.152073 type:complete len:348 (+) comp17430_c0_seq2:239-1282(+)
MANREPQALVWAREWSQLPAETQAKVMRLAEGIEASGLIRDRTYFFKRYPHCMVGNEVVDWAVQQGFAESRRQAVEMGNLLIKSGTMYAYGDHTDFKDQNEYYRMTDPQLRHRHIARAINSAAMYDWVPISYNWWGTEDQKFVILPKQEPVLLCYDSASSGTPEVIADLQTATIERYVDRQGRLGFILEGFHADKKSEQVYVRAVTKDAHTWTQVMILRGAKFKGQGFPTAGHGFAPGPTGGAPPTMGGGPQPMGGVAPGGSSGFGGAAAAAAGSGGQAPPGSGPLGRKKTRVPGIPVVLSNTFGSHDVIGSINTPTHRSLTAEEIQAQFAYSFDLEHKIVGVESES